MTILDYSESYKSLAYWNHDVHWPSLKREGAHIQLSGRDIKFVEELLFREPQVRVENEIKY